MKGLKGFSIYKNCIIC